MSTRIVVRHLSGSKANQIEQFSAEDLTELVIGRDRSATIVFDAPGDDLVSRRHAAIRRRPGDAVAYEIADLGSSNGTFVNGVRIAAETELQPGDTIELGRGGPRVSFDLDPRPLARTRVVQAAAMPATRVVNTAAETAPPTAAKQAVGRETVARMLTDQRRSTNRVWLYSAAAAVLLVALIGGGLYWNGRQGEADIARQIAGAQQRSDQNLQQSLAKMGLSPSQIAAKYTSATVQIRMQWRLYDKQTGRPVFQKTLPYEGKLLPAYVKSGEKAVVRWLTLDDENSTNRPIGITGDWSSTGSGFIVNPQGYILTNKHVAAPWELPYHRDEIGVAYLLNPNTNQYQLVRFNPNPFLKAWVPSEGGYLFDGRAPKPIGEASFDGRAETLTVRFPNKTTSLPAHLLRSANNADVALIKVDSVQTLDTVKLAASDDTINVGDRVVVLGYPSNDNRIIVERTNVENHLQSTTVAEIPSPTLTEGIIARMAGGIEKASDGTIRHTTMGDIIEMTINASGHGNSGGPVFDSSGRVIGLFTYGLQVGDSDTANESGAVPIKYGRQLIELQ